MSKTWKVVAKFGSYEEADQKRNVIRSSGKETKVHRCGPEGSLFAVKLRIDEKKPKAKEKKENISKDESVKLGDKRKEKRAKKRLRKSSKDKS
jgi:hypothetical protein